MLGVADVRNGVPHRAEAVSHVARELLWGERGDGFEQPVACPIVVIEQKAKVVDRHGVELTRFGSAARLDRAVAQHCDFRAPVIKPSRAQCIFRIKEVDEFPHSEEVP